MPQGRPKVPRVKVECFVCGKEVEKYLSQIRENTTGRFFCSTAHRNQVPNRPRTVAPRTCKLCGEKFISYEKNGGGKFCSKEHYDIWQRRNRVAKTCVQCGKEFTLKPSQAKHQTGRFCGRKCESASRLKRPLDRSHNGRPAVKDKAGYVRIYEPDHPKAMHGGWVFEHRFLMEQVLGRSLERDEHVHHANGVKDDNRPENLVVLSHNEHSRHEGSLRWGAMRKMEDDLTKYRERFGELS